MRWQFFIDYGEALIVIAFASLLSGFAQFYLKVKAGVSRYSITELVGECVISGSAGMTVGLLLIDHVSQPVAIGASSVAAHMGTRAIYMLEKFLSNKFNPPN